MWHWKQVACATAPEGIESATAPRPDGRWHVAQFARAAPDAWRAWSKLKPKLWSFGKGLTGGLAESVSV